MVTQIQNWDVQKLQIVWFLQIWWWGKYFYNNYIIFQKTKNILPNYSALSPTENIKWCLAKWTQMQALLLQLLPRSWTILSVPKNTSPITKFFSTTLTSAYKSTRRNWLCSRRNSSASWTKLLFTKRSAVQLNLSPTLKRLKPWPVYQSQELNTWTTIRALDPEWDVSATLNSSRRPKKTNTTM